MGRCKLFMVDLAQHLKKTETCLEVATMDHMLGYIAQWKIDLFNNFRRQAQSQIGVIATSCSDPRDPTMTVVFMLATHTARELGEDHFDYHSLHSGRRHAAKNPMFYLDSFGEELADSALHDMIKQAARQLRDTIFAAPDLEDTVRDQAEPKAILEVMRDGNPSYEDSEHTKSAEDLLDYIEWALPLIRVIRFPRQDDEMKMVCLFACATSSTTSNQTSSNKTLERFVRLLETIFITNGKGKLVFIGDKACAAIKSLAGVDTVEVIYEDTDGDYGHLYTQFPLLDAFH